MAILHVTPKEDSQAHALTVDGVCWCGPQVLDEGIRTDGYAAMTIIHRPQKPADPVKGYGMVKVRLCVETGRTLSQDESTAHQRAVARPGLKHRNIVDTPPIHLPE